VVLGLSVVVAVYGLIVGVAIDVVGIKYSLIVGILIQMVSKFALTFTSNVDFVYGNLYLLAPLGEAMAIPVINTSMRRYTTIAQRAIAYGLLYSFMNIGAVGAATGLDGIRAIWGAGFTLFGVVLSLLLLHFALVPALLPPSS